MAGAPRIYYLSETAKCGFFSLSDLHVFDSIIGLFDRGNFHVLCRVWQEQLINDLDFPIRCPDRC